MTISAGNSAKSEGKQRNFRSIPDVEFVTSRELDLGSDRDLRDDRGPGPRKTLQLGFVDLEGASSSSAGINYKVVSAANSVVGELPVESSDQLRVDLSLLRFYSGNLPDIWGRNEGLLRMLVDTRNPQDLTEPDKTAGFVTRFETADYAYSPGFLYPGVFRNVIIRDFLNLRVQLYELDNDLGVYYDKVKSVLDSVPALRDLDIVRAIPYLDVVLKLSEGLIKTFGKNPDDYLWGEVPLIEVQPSPDAPFLRTGIYVLFEKDSDFNWEDISYRDGALRESGEILNGTHLIFTLKVRGAK